MIAKKIPKSHITERLEALRRAGMVDFGANPEFVYGDLMNHERKSFCSNPNFNIFTHPTNEIDTYVASCNKWVNWNEVFKCHRRGSVFHKIKRNYCLAFRDPFGVVTYSSGRYALTVEMRKKHLIAQYHRYRAALERAFFEDLVGIIMDYLFEFWRDLTQNPN